MDENATTGRRVPANWYTGMNFVGFQSDAFAQASAPNVQTMASAKAQMGIGTAVLVPAWYVRSPTDSDVTPDPAKSPDDDGLVSAAASAREHGLAVVIKPHVDVLDGSFRGDLKPAAPDAFWAAYGREITHYAAIAHDIGAFALVVGTELTSLQDQRPRWAELIAEVRRIYSGKLIYAANWDAVRAVPFWELVDEIGVDFYPNEDAVAIDAMYTTMRELAARYGKPALFTEAGARDDGGGRQADAYRRLLTYTVAQRSEWFRGFWWYDWYTLPANDPHSFDEYTPRPPAKDVLKEFQAG